MDFIFLKDRDTEIILNVLDQDGEVEIEIKSINNAVCQKVFLDKYDIIKIIEFLKDQVKPDYVCGGCGLIYKSKIPNSCNQCGHSFIEK